MPDQPSPWVSLNSGELSATVNPLGAQLSTLCDGAGRDLLWNGDPSVWSGRAPVLFPIVGELAGGRYRVGAKSYALPRHGFARRSRFDVIEATAAGAIFRLQADEATLPMYPFRFELDIHFELQGPALCITARICNLGEEAMPASFGYHPAFRWPLPYGRIRSAHFIEFATEEPAPIRRLDAAGLLTAYCHLTPVSERRLWLDDALFRDDAVIFDAIQSRSVTYGAADGPRIEVSYPNSPYLGLWSKPGAGFICIEPWHGLADPEEFSADFRAKPGVFLVPAGSSLPIAMTIKLLDG